MTLERLISRGEEFHQVLGRESYLTGAGLKDTPEFQRIFDQYADLSDDAALEVARNSGSYELLEWVLDLRVGRRTAELEEKQLVWEQDATLRVGETEIPYLRAPNRPRQLPRSRLSDPAGRCAGCRRRRRAQRHAAGPVRAGAGRNPRCRTG